MIARTMKRRISISSIFYLSTQKYAGFIRNMSPINLMSLTDEKKKEFINSFDTIVSDCDGVLWHGSVPIPGAQDVMNNITSLNKKKYFLTNNSTHTRADLAAKFSKLGFTASEDEILSGAYLPAMYLKNMNFNKKVYVIGSTAIEKELNNVGIESFGYGPDNYCDDPTLDRRQLSVDLDPDVGAVIIGYDFYFSFPKLAKAFSYLNNPDCLFIATNADERYPVTSTLTVPGAGAFVAALQKCSEREPIVTGKPSPLAIDSVLAPAGVDPKRCLMIGDRCNTDIYFGNQRNMTTLLVLTGCHKLKDVDGYEAANSTHLVPTYYTSSIADLLEIMKL